jgi:hypothetical protein
VGPQRASPSLQSRTRELGACLRLVRVGAFFSFSFSFFRDIMYGRGISNLHSMGGAGVITVMVPLSHCVRKTPLYVLIVQRNSCKASYRAPIGDRVIINNDDPVVITSRGWWVLPHLQVVLKQESLELAEGGVEERVPQRGGL